MEEGKSFAMPGQNMVRFTENRTDGMFFKFHTDATRVVPKVCQGVGYYGPISCVLAQAWLEQR